MDNKEAAEKICALITAAELAIKQATEISDESGVGFSWDGCGYGMGGYYEPKPLATDPDWEESSCYEEEYGWRASSQSC